MTKVRNIAADLLASGISDIITAHPLISLAQFAVSIYVGTTSIDQRAEWLALEKFRDPLYSCVSPIGILVKDGIMPYNAEELTEYVSIYLNFVIQSDRLALEIAKAEISGEEFWLIQDFLGDRILPAQEILNRYCK